MSQYRVLSEKNKYYVPKETFLMLVHYCKQYPAWCEELEKSTDSSKAIVYDGVKVQSSNTSDTTSELAIKRAEISRKKAVIDETAQEVAGDLWTWLILGVCYDNPYYYLKHCGIPCGKDLYYHMRRKFYFELSKKV